MFAALGAGAVVLFGTGTSAVKLLLEHASPWLLAGILSSSGIGLLNRPGPQASTLKKASATEGKRDRICVTLVLGRLEPSSPC
ncbi:hypothetical protein SAMN02982919_02546 [Giesbergeria anulus]|uniref:Uncharacterized protein n=1 Tax=Giesbergeria anulus TaxID=180197 RepID=A0A1H9PY69_9BURK|nr:hypothetical protein SAMN02982919_02546 [Giesbergeria anulus]